MNRFGYYNTVDLNRGETLRIDGNEPLDNGALDDGGDKLGQCEGFQISGKEVYVTGKLTLAQCIQFSLLEIHKYIFPFQLLT